MALPTIKEIVAMLTDLRQRIAASGSLPAGGTTGQVLKKNSDTDGDVAWETIAGTGDMTKAVYDPTNKNGDAFSVDNHVDGSTNKVFSATEKTKLAGIAAGAEVNVNADWNAGSGDAQILNKPTLLTLADVYPVGAIYLSVVTTSPATLFGGTWSAISAGRVLIGLDSGDTDFDTAEETGGSKTISAGTPAGTISYPVNVPTFSGSALTTHTHTVSGNTGSTSGGTPAGTIAWPAGVPTFAGTSGQATSAASAGSTQRGATSSTLTLAAHTHSFTATGTIAWPAGVPTFSGSALTNHSHTQGTLVLDAISGGTPAGTIAWPANPPTFAGNALSASSIVQPYFVCYMWKRTA